MLFTTAVSTTVVALHIGHTTPIAIRFCSAIIPRKKLMMER